MNTNRTFFQLFKRLENLLKLKHTSNNYDYNDSFIEQFNKFAEKDNRLDKYKEDIYIIKNMRNFKAHNPNDEDYYLVSDNALSTLEEIIKIIENPQKAYDVAIKAYKLYKRGLNDSVLETMEVMKKRGFTHVPIIDEDDRLLGVFSENVFFNYYVDNRVSIDTSLEFKDILYYININNHIDEAFEFISKDTLLSDVEEMFKKTLSYKKRIAVVYITENGKVSEPILGMVTPWDLLG